AGDDRGAGTHRGRGRLTRRQQSSPVAVHHRSRGFWRQLRQGLSVKVTRLGYALRMGEVRSHDEAIGGADLFRHAFDVVLRVGDHKAVFLENMAGTLLELSARP